MMTRGDRARPPELVTLVLRAALFGLLKSCDLAWREMARDKVKDVGTVLVIYTMRRLIHASADGGLAKREMRRQSTGGYFCQTYPRKLGRSVFVDPIYIQRCPYFQPLSIAISLDRCPQLSCPGAMACLPGFCCARSAPSGCLLYQKLTHPLQTLLELMDCHISWMPRVSRR